VLDIKQIRENPQAVQERLNVAATTTFSLKAVDQQQRELEGAIATPSL